MAVVLFVILSHVALGVTPARAANLVVNSTGDSADVTPGDGLCDTGSLNSRNNVECTLRAAIEEANSLQGVDSILFGIPPSDPGRSGSPLAYRIQPATTLPAITGPVILDGTSQPDFAGSPIIVIDGVAAGFVDGIALQANDSEIRGLVVQNFDDPVAGAAIIVSGNDNVIAGNYVGTDVTGLLARGNDDGILVYGDNNIIGGTNAADRNVASGNADDGVSIDAGNNTVILGNYVGVNATGTGTIANQGDGVAVQFGATGIIVGGTVGNVISGNSGPGIRVRTAGTDGTSILGNLIGTDFTGNLSLGNGTYGIHVTDGAVNTTIGTGNVISGNTLHGVLSDSTTSGTVVVGNRIGTNSDGTAAIANGGDGVYADADGMIIGGSGAGEGNVISGNSGDGLRLERQNQVVKGNLIGTDITGSLPLGNGDDGVDTGSGTGGSVIGGTAVEDGNTIAFNGDRGITFRQWPGTSGVILGNSIFGNGALGIDLLGDGITANDPGDVDPGPPNELLNFPEIQWADEALGTVYVGFDLDVPAADYRIEFFANPYGADLTGYGEGQVLVSAVTVAGPGSGFTHNFSGSVGDIITATTTRVCGGCPSGFDITSEFSAAFTVVVGNNPPVLDPIGDQAVQELALLTFTATANDSDSPADTLSFSLSGEPSGASIGSASGVFIWTPSEVQGPGDYTFDVIVTDNGTPNLSDSETITVTVNETNTDPSLDPVGDRVVTEQNLLTFTATASDGDVPSNNLDFSLSGAPAGASIGLTSGVFSWTPTEGQGPGSYTFDVVVTDDGTPNLSDSETITVTVNETNTDPELINPGDQMNSPGEGVTLHLVASDADLPPNVLTWSASDLPAGLSIDPVSGVISGIVASPGEIGRIHNVTITVSDGNGGVVSVSFSWTVFPGNVSPSAIDDFYTVTKGETLTVGPAGILANDVDPDGDPLAVSLLVAPKQGVISLDADGSFAYMHTSGTLTNDSFTYQVSDGNGGIDSGLVTIGVVDVNSAPIAKPDVLFVLEDSSLLFDPLANDTDPDGDPLALGGLVQPTFGVITAEPTGQLRYKPPSNFAGSTTATYVVRDFNGGSDTAEINIIVEPVNDAPVGISDSVILTSYRPRVISVLANDTDPDGDLLSIGFVGEVENGDVALGSGAITFTPPREWVGTTTFTYTVVDQDGASDVAEVTVTMPDSTLAGARALAEELGADPLTFATLVPPFVAEAISSTMVESISLLASVFYQTIGAFQLPFVFLVLSLLTLVGLGGATNLPILLAGRTRNHLSVVLRDRESPLRVYEEPSMGSLVIYNFNPTAESILSTGRPENIGGTEWLPVHTASSEGWVEAEYLTEQVDLETFAEDKRPMRLVKEFAQRLRTGDDVTSLISDRGIVLALTGPPTQLAPQHFAALMGGRRLKRLPTVGGVLRDQKDFHFAVAQPFLAAFDGTQRITPKVAHSPTALIPAEVWNFRYLALGEDTSQPWLVFFEFEGGKPRIVGLGIDE